MPNFAGVPNFSVPTVAEPPQSMEEAYWDNSTCHFPHVAELITSHVNEQLCDYKTESDCLTTEAALEMAPCHSIT